MSYAKRPVDERLEDFKELTFIANSNKELIEDFVHYLQADPNVSEDRIYKYLGEFKIILREYVDFDLRNATKDDMKVAVAAIHSSDKSPWTQRDYKVAIKKLYRTIWEEESERPSHIKKILNANFMATGKNIENKRGYNALDPDEVMEMVDAADHPRNALIPLFLFETGARVGEVFGFGDADGIRIRNIDMQQQHCNVEIEVLKNDKDPRNLPLTKSVGLLKTWLEVHPAGDDPDAHLFVNLSGGQNTERGDKMSQRNVEQILNDLADVAGIDKRTNPHAFRHASATYKGMEWTVARLKWWHGWKKTETAENYVKENEERMRSIHLDEEGVQEEANDSRYEDTTCSRCGTDGSPGESYCTNCGMALDKETAEEVQELRRAGKAVTKARLAGKDLDDLKAKILDLQNEVDNLKE